ncbi:hypothetical protein KDW07_25445 [Burkholderia dolosa]|nr:hypothetical protein [Burkholderia dolosa]MBR8460498.1 hypothetical protein [Burkholderia dolosa]
MHGNEGDTRLRSMQEALSSDAYEHMYGGADRMPFDKVMVTKVMMDRIR